MGERRNGYRILVEEPKGKRPLDRPRRRWDVNVKMNLRWNEVVYTGLIWLRAGRSGRPL
jgi:hypothetical protein